MTDISAEQVLKYSKKYNAKYDEYYYYPYIKKARNGNRKAIEQLTKWKNPGKNDKPMNLSRKKKRVLNSFLRNLGRYRRPNGQEALRDDFRYKAPVWSIFWCHVLFDTHIFDRYTYAAYEYLKNGKKISHDKAKIKAPRHWRLFDAYHQWFELQFCRLSQTNTRITKRKLDRALFEYGKDLLGK